MLRLFDFDSRVKKGEEDEKNKKKRKREQGIGIDERKEGSWRKGRPARGKVASVPRPRWLLSPPPPPPPTLLQSRK